MQLQTAVKSSVSHTRMLSPGESEKRNWLNSDFAFCQITLILVVMHTPLHTEIRYGLFDVTEIVMS